MTGERGDAPLVEVLELARRGGALGTIDIGDAIAHSRLYVRGLTQVHGRVVDIGSGGGIPGLVVAWDRPDLSVVLVDRRAKRTDMLLRACLALEFGDRVEVVTGDVSTLSTGFDGLTARLFGTPASVVRIAERVVRPGGTAVVSEAPQGYDWSDTPAGGWIRSVLSEPTTTGRVVRFIVP